MSESQKKMDTARSRGIQLKEILKYGDYTAKTKQKHVLLHELEKLLNHNAPQFHKYSSEPTASLVSSNKWRVLGRFGSKYPNF